MGNIREIVCNALNKVGIPYGYISKDEGENQFIAFNIANNKAYKYYEDEERVTQYKITINIFSTGDYSDVQHRVEKNMQAAGFIKDYYPACIYIENMDIYNQPMYFNYYIEGEY